MGEQHIALAEQIGFVHWILNVLDESWVTVVEGARATTSLAGVMHWSDDPVVFVHTK